MTAFAEPENHLIWFFTRDDTQLAKTVANDYGAGERIGGADAMFVVTSRDQDLQACLGGRLTLTLDRTRIDKYWNAVVAAWYPEGRGDPRLSMLRFETRDAQVWLTEAGPMRFAWEIARANLTHREPNLGEQAHLDLS